MKYSISTRGLTKNFADLVAVNNVSFHIKTGEIFGFLGPNGSGKSTTMKMLCGLLAPTSGTGQILGYDITRDQDQIRSHIGYMAQYFSLYDDLTIEENLEFYSQLYDLPPTRAKENRERLMKLLELHDRRKQLAQNLSGGWKQKLALAVALVHEPKAIFLDEPTAGIDPVSRRSLWDILFGLAAEGITIFASTHYMDEAERCNSIAYIYNGKLIVYGSRHELKNIEHGIEGDNVEIETEESTKIMTFLEKIDFIKDVTIFGASVHSIVDKAEKCMPMIEKLLRERNLPYFNIRQIRPSLEDIFVSLTKREDSKKLYIAKTGG